MKTWLVTGGAGFIGSNFVLQQRHIKAARIINLDKLTYAGNVHNLTDLQSDADYIFKKGDIGDRDLVQQPFIPVSTRSGDSLCRGISRRSLDSQSGDIYRNKCHGHISSLG